MVPGPRAAVSPGSLLEMNTDRPHPNLLKPKLGMGPSNLFNLPFDSDVH